MADKTPNPDLQPSTPFAAPKDSSAYSPFSNGRIFQSSPPQQLNQSTMSGVNHTYAMGAHPKTSNLRNLLSPPEATPYDSFSPESSRASIVASKKPSSGFLAINRTLPSPPVSPETRLVLPDEPDAVIRDPILYPNREPSVQPHPQSLFCDDDELDAQKVVEAHMSARAWRKKQFREASPPVRDDYVLALEFKSQVAKLCNANQRKWAARERSYLAEDERIRKAYQHKTLANIAPAPAGSTGRSHVRNPKSSPLKPQVVRNGGRQAARPGPRPEGKEDSPDRRKPPANGTTREDKDFLELPDFSPPISTLPTNRNSLKVDWKGAPIDLSGDPHRSLLHPDEVTLAANLRLDCATYLTSKRRIFISRIQCLQRGKEFRKTDSQQACKIDVNKASKLWQAFEKVGWLDRKHVEQYIGKV